MGTYPLGCKISTIFSQTPIKDNLTLEGLSITTSKPPAQVGSPQTFLSMRVVQKNFPQHSQFFLIYPNSLSSLVGK